MTTKGVIHDFVAKLLLRNGDSNKLSSQDSLLLSGRLQSIDAVDIVVFLEEKFGIDFAEIGFDREQIDSVDAIYSLVESVTGHTS